MTGANFWGRKNRRTRLVEHFVHSIYYIPANTDGRPRNTFDEALITQGANKLYDGRRTNTRSMSSLLLKLPDCQACFFTRIANEDFDQGTKRTLSLGATRTDVGLPSVLTCYFIHG